MDTTAAPRGTVAIKLAAMVLAFISIVAVLLATLVFSLQLSAAVRGYVTGEGLWTRAQKDAVHDLELYARTRDEVFYNKFLETLDVSLGDHAARLEMEKPEYDYAVVEAGFRRGNISAADVPDMIFLFRNFQRISYLRDAVACWRRGDVLVGALRRAATALHTAVRRNNADAVRSSLEEIDRINADLAPLELQFSATLAEGARWVHGTLVWTGMLLTVLLLLVGGWAAWIIARQIRFGVRKLVDATAQVAAGNLDYQIEGVPADELGLLAHAFNQMIVDRREAKVAAEDDQRFLQALVGSFVGRVVACDTLGRVRILSTGTGEKPEPNPIVVPMEQWPERFGLYRPDGRTLMTLEEAPLYRALQGEVVQGAEVVLRLFGKGMRSMLANGQPIVNARGEKLGAVIAMIDITDRKRTEAELLHQAGELARSQAARDAKSQFLAAMSHEIRTPVNGLVGMLELHEGSALDPAQRDSVRIMRDSAQTLMAVIDDVLDFSKLEAGQLRMERVPLSLRETVESALETVAANAASKRVPLICHVQPELRAQVLGDPVRLRQVILNLTSNALKFTSSGHVAVKVESPDPLADPVRIRCSVRDTGIGIPPELQHVLFKPFSQAETSITRRYGGTGLGLTISKSLVQMMGGTIGFSSEAGIGSEFWFEVECAQAKPARAEPCPVDLAGVTVRIECADPEERVSLTSYLHAAGARLAGPDEAPTLLVQDGPTIGLILRGLDGEAFSLGRPVRYNALLREAARLCGRWAPALAPATVVPAVRAAVRRNARILVAEDHATNQLVIRRQLDRLGIAADLVGNGREALHKLELGGYALLLTDLHMPEMDGMSLTLELRRREQGTGRHLPVIGLTADVLPATVERCRAGGMDAVLRKPTTLDELNRELLRWIGAAASANADMSKGASQSL